MDELVKKIEQLIFIIDQLTTGILQENYGVEEKYMELLRESMIITIPDIVTCYLKPELTQQQHDMVYWTQAIKQIMEAMEKNDKFQLLDYLYFELKENLLIFKDVLQTIEVK